MNSSGTTQKIVIATGNIKKLVELQAIITQELGTKFQVIPVTDTWLVSQYGPYREPVEDGADFTENALIKARAAAEYTGLPAIADDSGLAVNALNGMPGIFSARWSGQHGDDTANTRLLLNQLKDVPEERLTAAFVCAAALVIPGIPQDQVEISENANASREIVCEGSMPGRLIREPRGDKGFGYDPIFIATGMQDTNAELSADVKNKLSHRGQAFRDLAAQYRITHGL